MQARDEARKLETDALLKKQSHIALDIFAVPTDATQKADLSKIDFTKINPKAEQPVDNF